MRQTDVPACGHAVCMSDDTFDLPDRDFLASIDVRLNAGDFAVPPGEALRLAGMANLPLDYVPGPLFRFDETLLRRMVRRVREMVDCPGPKLDLSPCWFRARGTRACLF
jgi:hypothetical protein